MFAISMRQPRPFSIFQLGNPYDNRYWKPKDWMIGRRIALYATANYSQVAEDVIIRLLGVKPPGMQEASRGAFVGVAIIAEVTPFDVTNSKWAFGPWCWRYERVVELPRPIPRVRGGAGFWYVPKAIRREIRRQLQELDEVAQKLELVQ